MVCDKEDDAALLPPSATEYHHQKEVWLAKLALIILAGGLHRRRQIMEWIDTAAINSCLGIVAESLNIQNAMPYEYFA